METTNSRTAILSKVLRIVYIGVLLVQLIMWALNVKGQPVKEIAESSNLSSGIRPVGANGPFNFQAGICIEAEDLRRRTVRDIYTSQIGVREKQGNSGPEVEGYLRYVNLPKGNPWCAAFVCWSLGEVGVSNPRTGWSPGLFPDSRVIWASGEQGTRSKEQGFPRSVPGGEQGTKTLCKRNQDPRTKIQDRGSVNGSAARQRSKEQGFSPGLAGGYGLKLVSRFSLLSTPNTGDVFGLYFPEKGRIAHVGFVDEWKDPWVTTVEGNTNVLGSREGDGVYRKRRLVRSIYKVAKYVE